jgi:hypothetical protein
MDYGAWDVTVDFVLEEYRRISGSKGFGSSRVLLTSKARPHVSLAMVARSCVEVGNGGFAVVRYGPFKPRYAIARGVAFDLFICVYDVDTSVGVVFRTGRALSDRELSQIQGIVAKMGMKNIETRFAGLQSGSYDSELCKEIERISMRLGESIAEIDLFGGDVRHLCIDSKTGLSYNLLLEDRIYRPGELANKDALPVNPGGPAILKSGKTG